VTLQEAIEQIEKQNSEQTIWIDSSKKWSADSTVFIAEEKEDGGAPSIVPSTHEYFLEVFLVSELVQNLKLENSKQIVERVIFYAENDV
jgi:hypothetical protein